MQQSLSKLSFLFLLVAPILVNAQQTNHDPNTPTGLIAALNAVLEHHPAIAVKQADIAAKGHAITSARANFYPSLSGQASVDDEINSFAAIRLKQPLWTFGKIEHAISFAKADEVNEQIDLVRVKTLLLEETALAYARIEGIRKKIIVAEDNVSHLNSLYKKMERRRQGHFASDSDLQLIYTRLLQAQAQQLLNRGDLEISLTQLVALTHIPVSSNQPIDRSKLLQFTQLTDADTESVIEQILNQNPTMLYRQSTITLANQRLSQNKLSDTPTLSLQLDRNFLHDGDDLQANTRAMVLFEASFEGLGLVARANTQASAALVESAQYALQQSHLEITRQATTLIQNLRLQYQLSLTQAESILELKEIVKSYIRQYDAGRKSWLDVLNMHRELNIQEIQWVDSDNRTLVFQLQIMALGNRMPALIEPPQHD